MQITSINSLNFNAHLVDNPTILKKDRRGNYKPCEVNFVEFDLKDEKDVKKISKICSMPEFYSLGIHIKSIVHAAAQDCEDYNNTHCYALVNENQKSFKNINKRNVLGIFTAYDRSSENRPYHIAYFITNNKYSNNKAVKPNGKYTGIGTGMVNSLKKLHKNEAIDLYPATEAIEFWKKNDFRQDGICMVYTPDINN